MKKNNNTAQSLKTGAKKALAVISLTAICATVAAPTIAYADVPAAYIIGYLQTEEDRTKVKTEEAQQIIKKFYGFDQNGYQTITMEEIEKAIRLSNALNGYFFDAVKFTNARSSEVINLDVNEIYDYYVEAYEAGTDQDMEYFYKNMLPYKPAIDAYITFASGTVSNNIKRVMANRITEVISSEGHTVTTAPVIIAGDQELYALVEVDGQLQKITLRGDGSEEVLSTCTTLDGIYNCAIANISGVAEEHDNSFMYNGIDTITDESAWLSLPDEEKQATIANGIAVYNNLLVQENYELTSEDPTASSSLTRSEKRELSDMGYDKDQIASAVKKEAKCEKVINKVLKKLN